MPRKSEAAVINGMNFAQPTPDDIVHRSPLMALHHAGGEMATKEITITGTGAEVVTNLFTVAEAVQLLALYGSFIDVTEVTTVSGCYFDLWDGANSVPITLDGVDCSGATLQSVISKNADDSAAAAFADADQCRYTENASFRDAFFGGLMTAKNGATTWIRFRCDTDANTDCQIRFTCIWVHRSNAGLLAAV